MDEGGGKARCISFCNICNSETHTGSKSIAHPFLSRLNDNNNGDNYTYAQIFKAVHVLGLTTYY